MDGTNKTDLLAPDWFCGGNSSLWEQDSDLWTSCHIDVLNSILQVLSFIVFSLVLLIVKYISHRQKWVIESLQRYPLHAAQWLLMTLAFLLHLFGLAEGCLTDQTFRTNTLGVIFPTQPHLYAPSICGLVMSVLAMVYYHHMEVWRCKHMSWPFLVYWCFALAGEILHLLGLIGMQLGSISVLRFDLCVLNIVVYFGLVAIQVNIVRVKICCSKHRPSASYNDGPPEAMKFTQEYSGFPSEVSYWWLNWLFRLGYKRPLEQADLGSLPEVHAASSVHNKFKKAYQREKDRARVENCKPSLWRVYWDVHGWRMVFAMVLKLSGEMCSYVGPMALNGIILWVGRVRDGSQQASEPHFITVSDFFQHGLVLVGITFIVACTRTLLMQTYEYWCAVVGIHFRSSIQTMVFEKSLRLSTFVLSNGDMTMGQITNHMSTDAMNVFYMIQFICWMVTVPIQLVVTMTLLVFQLGISALLGVVVFLFLIPIQIIFGNYMARLEKQALEYTEEQATTNLGYYKVLPSATIYVRRLLYAVQNNNLRKVVFDLNWGYPAKGKDFLDATAIIFSGTELKDYLDYRKLSHESMHHSGDVMDNFKKKGHHLITVNLQEVPDEFTHIFFTLSSFESPTISKFPNPSLRFYEEDRPDEMLCEDTVERTNFSQAIVMCWMSRDKGKWCVYSAGKASAGNSENYEPLYETISGIIANGL